MHLLPSVTAGRSNSTRSMSLRLGMPWKCCFSTHFFPFVVGILRNEFTAQQRTERIRMWQVAQLYQEWIVNFSENNIIVQPKIYNRPYAFQYGALALRSKGGCSLANLCAFRLFRHRLTSKMAAGWRQCIRSIYNVLQKTLELDLIIITVICLTHFRWWRVTREQQNWEPTLFLGCPAPSVNMHSSQTLT